MPTPKYIIFSFFLFSSAGKNCARNTNINMRNKNEIMIWASKSEENEIKTYLRLKFFIAPLGTLGIDIYGLNLYNIIFIKLFKKYR